MKNTLYPEEYVRSMADYDFEAAFKHGKRLVLYDIDNTVVPHGAPADEAAVSLFRKLGSIGFSFCAVSNNREKRVKGFCDAVGSPYICRARKPGRNSFAKAMALSGACERETIFFGDQIYTDIWGANRSGITSVLVKPVDLSTDEIQIRLKRFFEKPVIKSFLRSKNLAIEDYFR